MKKLLIGLIGVMTLSGYAADLKFNLNAIVVDKYVKEIDSEDFSNKSVKLAMTGRFSGKNVKNTSINETSETIVNRSIRIGYDEVTIIDDGNETIYPAQISKNRKIILIKARDLTGFDGGVAKRLSSYGVSKSSVKVSDMECELLSSSVLECEREVKVKYKK
jgi:hypothetical protein